MRRLIEKAEKEHILEKDEIVALLSDEESTKDLLNAADRVRAEYVGPAVQLRGLIEFSNFCRQNCCYCGIRRDNRQARRYRMTPREIVLHATAASKLGFHTVVMQSGEDVTFTADVMTQIIREIKKLLDKGPEA